jgi:hypothetical protein
MSHGARAWPHVCWTPEGWRTDPNGQTVTTTYYPDNTVADQTTKGLAGATLADWSYHHDRTAASKHKPWPTPPESGPSPSPAPTATDTIPPAGSTPSPTKPAPEASPGTTITTV